MAASEASRVHSWHELNDLTGELLARVAAGRYRFVLGIAGPPGAGKSTVAHQIADAAIPDCAANVAPMDGFHRPNAELQEMGLLDLKGVPASFDGEAFVSKLTRLVDWPPADIAWPTYDRSRQSVISAGTTVSAADKLVVVEGNYLLLEEDPWNRIPPLLDEIWYLDVPLEVIEPRLLERQRMGRDESAAARKVASTDLPNARLVHATRHRADIILRYGSG